MKTWFHTGLFRLVGSLILTIVFAFGHLGHASAGRIIYVRSVVGGPPTGSSWATAWTDLQDALYDADSGDEIWVATGTYKPSLETNFGDPRSSTFSLKGGVAIYGGFAATETLRTQRNPSLYVTVLTGDIGIAGDRSDNVYHVVTASQLSSVTILDGFTIRGGNANGASDTSGGGMAISGASALTLRNLIFSDNSASGGGGAIYNVGSNSALRNVKFNGNWAGAGGGMYSSMSSPTLINVTFSNNTATGSGGAIAEDESDLELTNVLFNGNSATNRGGAITQGGYDNLTLNNASFVGNSAADCGAIDTGSPGGAGLTNVTFVGNTASQRGGALCVWFRNAAILSNTTFSTNSAAAGGAVYIGAQNNTAELTHVTFSGNSASSGGAIYADSGSYAEISNSVFWGDITSEFGISSSIMGLKIADSVVQGACPFTPGVPVTCTHIVNTNPVLGPLQNNGGFTKTMALGVGTSALDISKTNCPTTDQRGLARPQGGGCDAGAVEAHVMALASNATYDGYAWEAGRALGYGGGANSTLTTLLVGDSLDNRRYYGFLDFNTSVLQGKTVIAAQVRVLRQSMKNNPFANQGTIVADLASPYFGTQEAVLGTDFQVATPHPAVTYPFSLVGPFGWYKGVLKTPALAYLNKVGTTQFRLRFTGTGYNNTPEYVAFYSGNATTAGYRPMLWIYYP